MPGRTHLVDSLYKAMDKKLSRKSVADLVETVFEHIKKTVVEHESFSYPGFGTFKVKTLPQRKVRNPHTGEWFMAPEKNTVSFKPSSALKESVNEKVETTVAQGW